MTFLIKGKTKYVISKIDGREYCKTTGKFTQHLVLHNLSEEEYCNKFENIERSKCLYCNNYATFNKSNWSYKDLCGSESCKGKKLSKTLQSPEAKKRLSYNAKKLWTNPEIKRRMIVSQAISNTTKGSDGLTGYERTKFKRQQTLEAKYGNRYWSNPEKTRETWLNKTQEELDNHSAKVSKGLLAICAEKRKDINKRISQTVLRNHGVKWATYIAGKHQKSNRFSSIEKDFCLRLAERINSETQHFQSSEGQFSIGKFFYDFRFKNKIIEFNGDFWHLNPAKYDKNFINPISKKAAGHIWESDRVKIQLAKESGFEVKIVWESDFKNNKQLIINECIEWLLN